METAYDWVTVAIFAGLVTLFLSRSVDGGKDDGHRGERDRSDDPLRHYFVPAVGCALANWLGNKGEHLFAIALIMATLGYAVHYLRTPSAPDH